MIAAIVENGVVTNVIKVSGLDHPVGDNQTIVDASTGDINKGWVEQDDGTFAAMEAE